MPTISKGKDEELKYLRGREVEALRLGSQNLEAETTQADGARDLAASLTSLTLSLHADNETACRYGKEWGHKKIR